MHDFDIPTIDIAPYLEDPVSANSARIVQEVKQACMTTGFFSLVGHGVPAELQKRLLHGSKTFFSLPLFEKQMVKPPGRLRDRGYENLGAQTLQADALPDLKESFFVAQHIPTTDPQAQAHPLLLGENVYPPCLPAATLREPAEEYLSAVLNLVRTMLEILVRGLPYGNDIFDDFVAEPPVCGLRLLHYPPQTSQDERQLGAGAHTDWGSVTLLYQNGTPGLEVLDSRTGIWMPVTPDPAAYVVNVGDMLALWTGGVYKSSLHRVINRSGTDRYSVAFFFDGNADVKLAPFDGSEPEGGCVLTVEEHMLERLGVTYGRVGREEGGGDSSAERQAF